MPGRGEFLGKRPRPLSKFRYRVYVPGFEEMGFTQVSNFRSEVPVIEVEEGGNMVPMKFPDRKLNSGNVLLSTGLGQFQDLRVWFEEHLYWKRTGVPQIMRNVMVTLLDEMMQPALGWEIFSAWPTILEIDGLDANNDEVVIHRVELANWGVARREPSTLLSGVPSTLSPGLAFG